MTYQEQIAKIVDEGIAAGRISAAARQVWIGNFTADPAAAEYFAGGFMRQADYTNKGKERAEQERQYQAQIAQERQQVQADRQRLQQWETQANAEIARLRATEGDSIRYRQAVAQYQQVLKTYNLSEYDPLAGGDAGTNGAPVPTQGYQNPPAFTPPVQPSQPQPQNFITSDQAVQALGNVVDLTGELQAIMAEHQYLYGGPMRENLIQEARQANQLNNIRGYWETKYNVQGKRAELDQKNRESEYDRIRQEERAKVLAEIQADPARVNGGGLFNPEPSPLNNYMTSRAVQHSPVPTAGEQAQNPAGQTRPLPEQIGHIRSKQDSISAAVSAFQRQFNPDGTPLNGRDSRTQ